MKSILAGLAITLLSTSAMADDTAKGSKGFSQLDANRDGALSQSEYDAWMMAQQSPGADRNPATDNSKPGT